jgi:hypothetical protein
MGTKPPNPIDPASLSTGELIDIRRALDTILFAPVTKAVDPLKVTARVEEQLAKRYGVAWRAAAGDALAESFGGLIEGEISQARIDAFAARMGVKLSKPLTPRQTKIIGERIRRAYEVSKRVTQVKELKVKPSFGLRDKKAISWMAREQVLWIGDFYSSQLSERIRAVTTDVLLTQGLSNRAAGSALARELGVTAGGKTGFAAHVPARYAGREGTELYFRQLASVASQRARVWSKVEAYSGAGVISYRLTNPNDHRTGQICQQMSGQVFNVSTAVEHIDRTMAAETPDEVKAIQPWVQGDKIAEALGGAAKGSNDATQALQELGAILPPFHPLCRTEPVILSRSKPRLPAPAPAKPAKVPGKPAPSAAPFVPLPGRARVPQPLPPGVTETQLAQLTPAEIDHMWGGWSLEAMPMATEVDVQAAAKAFGQMEKDLARARKAIEKLVTDKARRDLLLFGDDLKFDGIGGLSWNVAGDNATLKRVADSLLKPTSRGKQVIDSWPKPLRDDLRRYLPDQAIASIANKGYTIEQVLARRMGKGVLGDHAVGLKRIRVRKSLKARPSTEISRAGSRPEVLVHEVAHGIDRGVLDDAMNKFFVKLPYERVSWYADTKAVEDVAESVALNLVPNGTKALLPGRAPIRHRIVTKMFRNDESYRRAVVIFSKFGEGTYSFEEALKALEAL